MITRFDLLDALCRCAEYGMEFAVCPALGASASAVAAALCDTARFSLLGGREGLARSLSSVHAASVVRFLQRSQFAGVEQRVIKLTCSRASTWRGIAISHDGEFLIVPYESKLRVFRAADGTLMHVIGQAPGVSLDSAWAKLWGGDVSPPLWFSDIQQVSVAPDGFVFVSDHRNRRVQVLTPDFGFHSVVSGANGPHVFDAVGVCASDDLVVVSCTTSGCHVLHRGDGSTRCHIPGRFGHLCFFRDGRSFAAVTCAPCSWITVFGVTGEVLLEFGKTTFSYPYSLASTAAGQLVVTDCAGIPSLMVFSPDGKLEHRITKTNMCMRNITFAGVAVHGCAIYARNANGNRCSVFM